MSASGYIRREKCNRYRVLRCQECLLGLTLKPNRAVNEMMRSTLLESESGSETSFVAFEQIIVVRGKVLTFEIFVVVHQKWNGEKGKEGPS